VLCSPGSQPPPPSTLFPYTTLFRSGQHCQHCQLTLSHVDLLTLANDEPERHIPLAAIEIPLNDERMVPCRGRGEPHALVILDGRSEEHTSELQSREKLVCRLLLAKK